MAEIIWTEPALSELDEIADYIALDNPQAARDLVHRVFQHVEQLAEHPESGSRPSELKKSRYRQIVEPPCRIFYRFDGKALIILYVMRSERSLRRSRLADRG
ncbi:type II toxin-antitoxin system RelE/ParE family toxin [Dyella caseinilytica]|uniref:Type II toxin-antitoxin system RelE/ParE family toxin n=1 Tax=Dyella caseinilytica TaxID=1849581 RepID=A0ABX7GSN7_9GAMM|nr:type II toxin-antitoxin system RelE/ParE family toxin [Dyella caseinilytica]QRN53041.1 type II toxin-antitoxin system RelE/ParE family toxin [Dyella caseinilytica]GGA10975.1 plasmid stabilization protein [Dyella caseinilytica]